MYINLYVCVSLVLHKISVGLYMSMSLVFKLVTAAPGYHRHYLKAPQGSALKLVSHLNLKRLLSIWQWYVCYLSV